MRNLNITSYQLSLLLFIVLHVTAAAEPDPPKVDSPPHVREIVLDPCERNFLKLSFKNITETVNSSFSAKLPNETEINSNSTVVRQLTMFIMISAQKELIDFNELVAKMRSQFPMVGKGQTPLNAWTEMPASVMLSEEFYTIDGRPVNGTAHAPWILGTMQPSTVSNQKASRAFEDKDPPAVQTPNETALDDWEPKGAYLPSPWLADETALAVWTPKRAQRVSVEEVPANGYGGNATTGERSFVPSTSEADRAKGGGKGGGGKVDTKDHSKKHSKGKGKGNNTISFTSIILVIVSIFLTVLFSLRRKCTNKFEGSSGLTGASRQPEGTKVDPDNAMTPEGTDLEPCSGKESPENTDLSPQSNPVASSQKMSIQYIRPDLTSFSLKISLRTFEPLEGEMANTEVLSVCLQQGETLTDKVFTLESYDHTDHSKLIKISLSGPKTFGSCGWRSRVAKRYCTPEKLHSGCMVTLGDNENPLMVLHFFSQ